MAYLVSYDLRGPARSYQALYDELQRAPAWWHHLTSTWLIVTSETAQQLYDRLAPFMDESDSLLIIGVTRDYSGWLPEEAWAWIQQHV